MSQIDKQGKDRIVMFIIGLGILIVIFAFMPGGGIWQR